MMAKSESGKFRGDLWFKKQVEERMRRTIEELQAQGKAPKGSLESLRGTEIYKTEFKRHVKLFKEEQKQQAEKRDIHKAEAALKAQAENEILAERDKQWAIEHESDNDEQLLEYLQHCAAALGHTPMRREVIGSTYIAERFGNWAVALTIAELPLPKNIKPPKQTALDHYRKRRKESALE